MTINYDFELKRVLDIIKTKKHTRVETKLMEYDESESELSFSGIPLFSSSIIKLGILGDKELVLNALAHEYGHSLDHRFQVLPPWYLVLWKLTAVKPKWAALCRRLSHPRIVKSETRAWDLGFQFLQENGVEITRRMEEDREMALETYRRSYQYPRSYQ